METPSKITTSDPPKLVTAAQLLDAADRALKDACAIIRDFPAGKDAIEPLTDAIVLERDVADALNRYLSGRPFKLGWGYEVRIVRVHPRDA